MAWQIGVFDDPPAPEPKIPTGGVRYEGQIYADWKDRPLPRLQQALNNKNVYCPNYKYRKSVNGDEYIVYCLMGYDGRDVAMSAYLVFPNIGEVVGPSQPDDRLK